MLGPCWDHIGTKVETKGKNKNKKKRKRMNMNMSKSMCVSGRVHTHLGQPLFINRDELGTM
jgi:hypothetical protein